MMGDDGMQFENKMTLGNIVTIIVLIVGMAAGYTNLEARQINQAEKMKQLDDKAIGADARLRTVEVVQAGQSSDLRNIQIGINEIKAAVDRLAGQP